MYFNSSLVLNNTLETEPCYRKYLFYEPCTFSLNEGPVHTYVFLFENAYISISLGLLSTLICWAFPLKMHLFEKCTWEVEQNKFTYVLYECGRSKIVKNALKWKAWPKNITGVCVCSMVIEFNLCHNAQLYHFQTLKCGQSKMYDQNSSVDANWLMRFQWQQKRILLKMHQCRQPPTPGGVL